MTEYEILRAIIISHKPNFNLFKISRYKKVLIMELEALVHFRKYFKKFSQSLPITNNSSHGRAEKFF